MAAVPGMGMATAPLHAEVSTEVEVESQRKKSKFAAFGVAILVHAVILLLAGLWIVSEALRETATITVVGDTDQASSQMEKKTFTQRVAKRPTSSSARSIQTISANAQSAVAVPEIDEIVDDPLDLGTMGLGDGLGFGAGTGMGGASFLGITGSGDKIMLVIDTSSSMPQVCGPDGIAAIRKEIARTINALAPTTEFNIICYSDDADLFKAESVRATAAHKAEAIKFMEGYFGAGPFRRTRTEQFYGKGNTKEVKVDGATYAVDSEGVQFVPLPPDKVSGLEGTTGGSRIDLGLVAAFEKKPETIFILSDGAPSTQKDGKPLSDREIVNLIEKEYKRLFGSSKENLTINSVTIKGLGADILKDIARKFGGKHKDINPERL